MPVHEILSSFIDFSCSSLDKKRKNFILGGNLSIFININALPIFSSNQPPLTKFKDLDMHIYYIRKEIIIY